MSLKSDCRESIYSYASQERQNLANIMGTDAAYIGMVIHLLLERYEALKTAGDEWSIGTELTELLDSKKPY
jgi:hypothetical protein